MQISCREVIRELSNYIDNDLTSELRTHIEEHLSGCAHCTAIHNGLRNTITVIGDGRSFELPEGFSRRLRARLSTKHLS